MSEQIHHLTPLCIARNHREYAEGISGDALQELAKIEAGLTDGGWSTFSVGGFCIPCGQEVLFRVDMMAGGHVENGIAFPNWRERLICPGCRMSNRQRLMAALIMQQLQSATTRQNIYLMEQTTPIYKWITQKYCEHVIVGSEYFGSDKKGGDFIGPFDYQAPLRFNNLLSSAKHKFSLFYSMLRMGGIRHEDITRLSLPADSLDLIVSNDVFEHVPDPAMAFRECARVLRSGGVMLATIPFHGNSDISVVRAHLDAVGIRHTLTPMYHGNPVSAEGSLVFTDFGWDIIRSFTVAGFANAAVEVYGDAKHGHLGGGQIIFRVTK